METEQDTSKMLLTVSSFGESLRRLSTGGGVFNEKIGILQSAKSRF
jgi:hypothetical protein